MARAFLAKLMQHVDREKDLLDSTVRGLNPQAQAHLAHLLFERRVLAAMRELKAFFAEHNAVVELLVARDGIVKARICWPDGSGSGLKTLRRHLVEHLKERVPEVNRIEVDQTEACCR